ncbi:MAG: helix-turn-helix domain-containing protein [Gammaproteobacteria bacterium]|nr:helix-turn-helix domain-containing protein [Gammaproteobacteria bacterium]
MAGFVLRLLIVALGLWLASELVPGIEVRGVGTLLGAALLLGIVNAVVRPVFILLTLPLTQTLEELAHISGIGERKLAAYGEDFLEVILAHVREDGKDTPVTGTAAETLRLFRLGLDIPAIATRRSLKEATIYSHLALAIASGEIKLREVVPLDEEELARIRAALREHGGQALKPVFEALCGRYSYEVLRCMQAMG